MRTDHRRRICCCGLIAALCCTAAVAQDGGDDEGRDAYLPKAFIRGIEARLPAEMREDEPLLVGLEQQQNHFRDRTPLLAGADTAPQLVDVDELYERRLSMYEAGATDVAATGITARDRAAPAVRPQPRVPVPAPNGFGVDADIFRSIMLGLGGALAIGAAASTFLRRRRDAAAEEGDAARRRRRRD